MDYDLKAMNSEIKTIEERTKKWKQVLEFYDARKSGRRKSVR